MPRRLAEVAPKILVALKVIDVVVLGCVTELAVSAHPGILH